MKVKKVHTKVTKGYMKVTKGYMKVAKGDTRTVGHSLCQCLHTIQPGSLFRVDLCG